VDYWRFEQEFLRLAFTTSIELTPAALAFFTGLSIREAEQHMQRLVSQGVLELESDDDGHIRYAMPDRPRSPLSVTDAALAPRAAASRFADVVAHGHADGNGVPPRAIVVRNVGPMGRPGRQLGGILTDVTPGQAVAAMFLNAMVCPGVGSLVGGKTRAGLAQLSLFLIGIPLIVVAIGLPMIIAAWTWGIATGAQLIAEART
jgi:hypothetical protein